VSDTVSQTDPGRGGAGGAALRILVLGIGNTLMRDEGVGVHALLRLKSRWHVPESVELIDGGTSGFDLLPQLEDADHLIAIDALQCSKSAPGTVITLRDEEVPAFFRTKISPHQVGLSDVLAMLSFKGTAPTSVTLLGVVPNEMSLGMELSAVVSGSVDRLVAAVVEELARDNVTCELRPE
jgi:hydrogenase maturation protease